MHRPQAQDRGQTYWGLGLLTGGRHYVLRCILSTSYDGFRLSAFPGLSFPICMAVVTQPLTKESSAKLVL